MHCDDHDCIVVICWDLSPSRTCQKSRLPRLNLTGDLAIEFGARCKPKKRGVTSDGVSLQPGNISKKVCSSLEAALSRNEVQPRLIICMTPSGRSSNAENL